MTRGKTGGKIRKSSRDNDDYQEEEKDFRDYAASASMVAAGDQGLHPPPQTVIPFPTQTYRQSSQRSAALVAREKSAAALKQKVFEEEQQLFDELLADIPGSDDGTPQNNNSIHPSASSLRDENGLNINRTMDHFFHILERDVCIDGVAEGVAEEGAVGVEEESFNPKLSLPAQADENTMNQEQYHRYYQQHQEQYNQHQYMDPSGYPHHLHPESFGQQMHPHHQYLPPPNPHHYYPPSAYASQQMQLLFHQREHASSQTQLEIERRDQPAQHLPDPPINGLSGPTPLSLPVMYQQQYDPYYLPHYQLHPSTNAAVFASGTPNTESVGTESTAHPSSFAKHDSHQPPPGLDYHHDHSQYYYPAVHGVPEEPVGASAIGLGLKAAHPYSPHYLAYPPPQFVDKSIRGGERGSDGDSGENDHQACASYSSNAQDDHASLIKGQGELVLLYNQQQQPQQQLKKPQHSASSSSSSSGASSSYTILMKQGRPLTKRRSNALHRTDRTCLICSTITTSCWYRDKFEGGTGEWLCRSCYDKKNRERRKAVKKRRESSQRGSLDGDSAGGMVGALEDDREEKLGYVFEGLVLPMDDDVAGHCGVVAQHSAQKHHQLSSIAPAAE